LDFRSQEAAEANKLENYYKGEQTSYLIEMLNGGQGIFGGRRDWVERGFKPIIRNIVNSIVDKSGLLFNKPPKLSITPFGETRSVVDATFNRIMHRADWLEFFQNVDVYTRLLKSTVVLQQKYIKEDVSTVGGMYRFNNERGDALMLTMHHKGNSVVRLDITGTRVIEFAYLTTTPTCEGDFTYRVITPHLIEDYEVNGDAETLVKSVENADGIVPASMFYDINKPTRGVWVSPPEDILLLQEAYNLYLTDSFFATAHQMQKTLFHDSPIVDPDAEPIDTTTPANPNQFQVPRSAQHSSRRNRRKPKIGGLGATVQVEAGRDGKTPMVKFDGPESDLRSLHSMIVEIVREFAHDWGVNMRAEGQARANSGFQLVVEEMDNLQLRERRAQSFQAGLRRFYDITQQLYPELIEGSLKVDFAPPSLPINTTELENTWDQRINGSRGSVLDYYMEVKGMSEEEALQKIHRDIEIKKLIAAALPQPEPIVASADDVPAGDDQEPDESPS
jgi:hypothetical protein